MRRLLSAFAGQYLGAVIGFALTVFLFLTGNWRHSDVVLYLVVPIVILSTTGVGFAIGGRSKSSAESSAAGVAVGLPGAGVGMVVMAGAAGCLSLIAYYVVGAPGVSDEYETIGVVALMVGSVIGAAGGFMTAVGRKPSSGEPL